MPSVFDAAVAPAVAEAVVQMVRGGDAAKIPESSPAFGKKAIEEKPTAYVCIGPQCSAPVTEPEALVATAKSARVAQV